MREDLIPEMEKDLSRGLIVVPGISSGPLGSPFDEVVESVRGEIGVVCVDAWEGAEDLGEMNLEILHTRLKEAFELLKSNDCESIGLLGKSFGGQLGLTWPENNKLDFMVLWAPAVGFEEYNVDKWRSTKLKHAQTATDISIDRAFFEGLSVRTKIIHGTEDQVVNIENSKEICKALPECEFSVVENADHSFTDKEERLIDETLHFLENIQK